MDRRRVFQAVALVGAVAAYGTIVFGGIVRSEGAGLACPDWPLCHGSLVPDLSDPLIALEYTHRLVAATTSLFLVLTMVLAWLWFRADLRVVLLSTMSVALLVSQVALGALTITSSLDKLIVTAHLAIGTATFATALALAIVALVAPPAKKSEEVAPA